jgi:Mg2+-importing ATPase
MMTRDTSPKMRSALAAWLFGLVMLAAVVTLALHLSEARELWSAARRARPAWLLAALALQALTYLAQGEIFRDVARAGASSLRVWAAYRISLTKLFVDQALPSAGLSGTVIAAQQLARTGMQRQLLAAAVAVSIASYQIAYALSLVAALPVVAAHSAVGKVVALGVAGFALASLVWSGLVIGLSGLSGVSGRAGELLSKLQKLRVVRELLGFLSAAEPRIVRSPRLLTLASGWQLSIIVLDAATLWVLLLGLGEHAQPAMVFASFMLANVFRAIGLVPGGLGTFEAASVVSLHAAGVPVAVALAATLLFRSLSFWLPMPVGFYFYQRAFRDTLHDDASESV